MIGTLTIVGITLVILNIVLGLILLGTSLYYYLQARKVGLTVWVKLFYGIIGVYWAIVYVFILLAPPEMYNTINFAQKFIRPGITFTLIAMASGSILGVKRLWNGE